jgi:hypothetical protein
MADPINETGDDSDYPSLTPAANTGSCETNVTTLVRYTIWFEKIFGTIDDQDTNKNITHKEENPKQKKKFRKHEPVLAAGVKEG